MSEYTLPFEASFSLYDPNGVRVYFKIQDASMPPVNAHINGLLSDGYTVQEPVPSEGEKRYRITRYTKSHQKMDNGDALPVLNLWSDNGEYPQLSVWPTTYREDGTQIVADIEHLFDMTVPLCDVTMRDKVPGKAWGHCDMVAIGVPDTDMNGEPKMTKGGHVKYRFHHIEGTGAKAPAPSTNGSGPTEDHGMTPAQLYQQAVDRGVQKNHASNKMKKMVRELFSVDEGQEHDTLKNLTPAEYAKLTQAYLSWTDEQVETANMSSLPVADEEIPF